MAAQEQVIVLGADVEGLTAAAFLAQAGRRVVLLDPRSAAGGASARIPVGSEHAVPGLRHDPCLTRRALLAPLDLEQHGLAWRPEPAQVVVGADGETVRIARDPDSLQGANGDAAAFATWRTFLAKLTPLILRVLDEAPPDSISPGPGELMRLARTGLALRTLGERDMLELMRLAPMCAQDWMHERFTSPLVRAGLVAPCLHGTVLGPRAAGTGALVMLAETARGSEPVGGAAALVDALLEACRSLGVELRIGSAPNAFRVGADGIEAVVLADGEALETRTVVSALDPGRTLLELLPGATLTPQTETEVAHWRCRGADAALLVALSAVPEGLAARTFAVGRLDELERNADNLKYGRMPEQPWLDVRVWNGPGCAPPGGATLSVLVHGVPHDLVSGWTEAAREALAAKLLTTLERLAPGVTDAIVARELLSPTDIETRCGLPGGHLEGGELALDQLWIQRPALSLARYATSVPGLFLCGAASHPGGPFLGGAGALGARAVLAR